MSPSFACAAGVRFLYDSQRGTLLRRPASKLGNEYVFDKVAKSNIALFKKYGVKKMLTLCPHCYSTFKHDYRDFGADFEVIHHTELLHGLLKSASFRPPTRSGTSASSFTIRAIWAATTTSTTNREA